jgi:hypothetical protein
LALGDVCGADIPVNKILLIGFFLESILGHCHKTAPQQAYRLFRTVRPEQGQLLQQGQEPELGQEPGPEQEQQPQGLELQLELASQKELQGFQPMEQYEGSTS